MDDGWKVAELLHGRISTLAATGVPIAIIPLGFLLALKCIYIYSKLKPSRLDDFGHSGVRWKLWPVRKKKDAKKAKKVKKAKKSKKDPASCDCWWH